MLEEDSVEGEGDAATKKVSSSPACKSTEKERGRRDDVDGEEKKKVDERLVQLELERNRLNLRAHLPRSSKTALCKVF